MKVGVQICVCFEHFVNKCRTEKNISLNFHYKKFGFQLRVWNLFTSEKLCNGVYNVQVHVVQQTVIWWTHYMLLSNPFPFYILWLLFITIYRRKILSAHSVDFIAYCSNAGCLVATIANICSIHLWLSSYARWTHSPFSIYISEWVRPCPFMCSFMLRTK